MSKDWTHVEEAIDIVNWVLSLCMVDRLSMEKQPFKIIVLPGWIFSGFHLPYEFENTQVSKTVKIMSVSIT